ncbi:MAG: hypothetical protein HUU10_10750 [Bacteroidetes bacterium]|nr:hypothetical protein [Bacteroidota bacterium]
MHLTPAQRRQIMHTRLVGAGFLLISLFPVPDEFSTLTRLVVTVVCFLNLLSTGNRHNIWPIMWFAVIGLVFNPLFPPRLTEIMWMVLSLVASGVLAFSWWRRW